MWERICYLIPRCGEILYYLSFFYCVYNYTNYTEVKSHLIVILSNQMSRIHGWQFTWNNYTDEDIEYVKGMDFNYLIFGKEVGKEKITPHLQGFIHYENAKSFSAVRKLFKNNHVEPAKAYEALIKYNKKDGDFFESGIKPVQGKKKRSVDVKEEIELTLPDRPWQSAILELIKLKPNRMINWYWEPIGGVGKTTLCRWLVGKYDACYISGKATDCKYGIVKYKEVKKVYPKIVLWNIPRTHKDHISYDAVESIEDGLFFSGKYESGQVLMNNPHVFVFANFKPNGWELSERKWNVVRITMEQAPCDHETSHNMLESLKL